MRLNPYPVRLDEDFEVLRQIRNSCREFFTNNTAEITKEQQHHYAFAARTNPDLRHYLYRPPYAVGQPAVGFSRIETRGGLAVVTYGLLPEFRGQGLGTHLIYLTWLAAGLPILGEIRKDNERSIRAHRKLGACLMPGDSMSVKFAVPWPPPPLENP